MFNLFLSIFCLFILLLVYIIYYYIHYTLYIIYVSYIIFIILTYIILYVCFFLFFLNIEYYKSLLFGFIVCPLKSPTLGGGHNLLSLLKGPGLLKPGIGGKKPDQGVTKSRPRDQKSLQKLWTNHPKHSPQDKKNNKKFGSECGY